MLLAKKLENDLEHMSKRIQYQSNPYEQYKSINIPFSKKTDIFYRIKRLIDKDQMGDLFKVLFITKKENKFTLGF